MIDARVLCLSAAALWCAASAQLAPGTPAYYQLEAYSNSTQGRPGTLTTSYGVPVTRRQADSSLDFITNPHYMEEMFRFANQRTPPRVINAKGAGAFGEFVVTHDVTNITNVAMLDCVGKKTPVFTRFSSVLSERGTPDTIRNPYGFATKFYTEEGNWDFTGFTTDTFTIKDPLFMPAGCRIGLHNAATNLPDASGFYDFLLSFDTSVSILSQFLGDMGVPASYRHMPGYSIHTFQVENAKGEVHFVRYKMTPRLGERYFNQSVATAVAGSRPYYYTEDLYNAIGRGDYPVWELGFQVIPASEVKKAGFNIHDVTLRWPYKRYPVRPIGLLTLNRNPENYYRDVEQAAFNPANLVPGLQASDPLYLGRTMQYYAAHVARLGPNYNEIAVNRPLVPVRTYTRDGAPPVGTNGGPAPNYYPNAFNGPQPVRATRTTTDRVKVKLSPDATDTIKQTTEYYEQLSAGARRRLAENTGRLLADALPSVRRRGLKLFGRVSPRLERDIQAVIDATHQANANATPPPVIED